MICNEHLYELWLVQFNPKKTETMLCTRKGSRIIHQSLSFSGEIIKEVTSHKYIGLNIASFCDLLVHIDYIKEKSLTCNCLNTAFSKIYSK